MFKLLGVPLALYVAYAAAVGEVLAKSGPGVRKVRRAEPGPYFWIVLAIYTGLALVMIVWF
jgi:hypothetical protein